MIKDKIYTCSRLIDNVQRSQASLNANKDMVKKNNSFFEGYRIISADMAGYTEAHNRLGFILDDTTKNKMITIVNTIKTSLEKQTPYHCDTLQRSAANIHNVIEKEWGAFSIQHSEDKKRKLALIKIVISDKDYSRCDSIIKNFSKWPQTNAQITFYDEACTFIETTFISCHFSDKISTFIDKISKKQATLKDLDEEVLEWIKTNDMSEKIKLFM